MSSQERKDEKKAQFERECIEREGERREKLHRKETFSFYLRVIERNLTELQEFLIELDERPEALEGRA